jgi:hypothetical protein
VAQGGIFAASHTGTPERGRRPGRGPSPDPRQKSDQGLSVCPREGTHETPMPRGLRSDAGYHSFLQSKGFQQTQGTHEAPWGGCVKQAQDPTAVTSHAAAPYGPNLLTLLPLHGGESYHVLRQLLITVIVSTLWT